jgi:Protein of unknown function (DUF3500)
MRHSNPAKRNFIGIGLLLVTVGLVAVDPSSFLAARHARPGLHRSQAPTVSTNVTQNALASARTFLTSLTRQQHAIVNIKLNATTRTKWSNLPSAEGYRDLRNGLALRDLTAGQREAALAVVASVLSPAGFQKVREILRAEELKLTNGGLEYQIAILGEPSASAPWMIQFGGHHVGINATIIGTHLAFTPLHIGAEPLGPLRSDTDRAFALMHSLNSGQQNQTMLAHPVGENGIFGPGKDGETIVPEGIRAAEFNTEQRAMLIDLIRGWISLQAESFATKAMAEIEENIADTYFAWSGPVTDGSPAYFRIQGPTVEIEYAPQAGLNSHIHSFYRDPTNDYGVRWY